MKSKQIIRFYFSADSLNGAMDNLITQNALSSAHYDKCVEYYADKICALIGAKQRLGELWQYLDGVMSEFAESERNVLRFYGAMRGGFSKLSAANRKEIKRVTVKFVRKAKSLGRYEKAIKLVGEYYCLIK